MVAVTIAFLIAVIFVLLSRKRKNQELQNIVEMKSISDREPAPNVSSKKKRSQKLKISCTTKPIERKLLNNLDWLSAKWEVAQDKRDADEDVSFLPSWYFDSATERQYDHLSSIGVEISKGELNKGEASDIIGIFHPASDEDKVVLKFFKIPLTGLNQTKARHEIKELFENADNVKKWEHRPASQLQKEFYRFFDFKVPASLTYSDAKAFIVDFESRNEGDMDYHLEGIDEQEAKQLSDNIRRNQSLLEEWSYFEEIVEEFDDAEFRDSYNIKKVPISMIKKAIAELRNESVNIEEAAGDVELIIDKLIELKPELEKA
ncbi:hypothetical protein [Alteromonas sp. P256]|uniref:hypothetical protein n=1 Tax=Alteromonas sp. P256 TaxID=3117399 RepID=UPI002FDF0E7B